MRFWRVTEPLDAILWGLAEPLEAILGGSAETLSIIIITYIYHALINALSAHMKHINLNMIFYTHVEHSPTKTVYIKYYIYKNIK